MQVIPVIDIRNGVVVRAVAGRRKDYAPIVTPLATSSAPLDVASGLMSLHCFNALYIADLDAIEGRGDNRASIRAIAEGFPQLRLWVDAGLRRVAEARDWLEMDNVDVVFGSETIGSPEEIAWVTENARAILSLDFKGRLFLGPETLLFSPEIWPRRVIVMTLHRVGAGAGPDLARVAHIAADAGDRTMIAAGGVRDMADLRMLERSGAAGALVATALHDGRLGRDDLLRLSQK
ncbi:HisA/HisF-related TIM barrel protein [Methylocystis parvus]|uniref:Nickel transporter n=1 Tax=Methylocystis parvus TaxID=134 RepID=A0A6B8M3K7_9HYPH|nr:HisA/HisF-related TIM barrel protein [Methylocystis parvus]QGM96908.1 nickel transporter [Methylocystis parvus]WBJ99206.1 HisA/HisF-related TIM barrel protein [Methylocystis parvus OBBP]